MAKINKTYKAGDEFTPYSVNEIITAVNKNVDDIAKKANASALGTQVTYSLSGTTLTITTK